VILFYSLVVILMAWLAARVTSSEDAVVAELRLQARDRLLNKITDWLGRGFVAGVASAVVAGVLAPTQTAEALRTFRAPLVMAFAQEDAVETREVAPALRGTLGARERAERLKATASERGDGEGDGAGLADVPDVHRYSKSKPGQMAPGGDDGEE